MGHRRRKSGRARRAGVRAIRRLRKLDPIVAGLAALIVVLSVAWGGLYWKESSGQSPVAYAEANIGANYERQEGKVASVSRIVSSSIPVAGAEADYVKAYESPGESNAGIRAQDEEYLPPGETTRPEGRGTKEANAPTGDPRGSQQPQSALDGNGSESPIGGSTQPPGGTAEASPAPSGADDELPVEPSAETSMSPEEKYGQEMEKAQASCASLMNGKMEEAEEALKPIDRGNPFEAKAWSDTWTRELSGAEASCDESFAALTERAMGESVSQGIIDEWTLAYEARKKELQADSQAKLQRLLKG
ncbi:hypothetical protein ACFPPD_17725 [Cohnella suwonensis]|uniref:Uncharacterized protein n=1 Tax=Cohnella suwonensis TaxID=696072 RepID=A0ABW0LXD7_9BACL